MTLGVPLDRCRYWRVSSVHPKAGQTVESPLSEWRRDKRVSGIIRSDSIIHICVFSHEFCARLLTVFGRYLSEHRYFQLPQIRGHIAGSPPPLPTTYAVFLLARFGWYIARVVSSLLSNMVAGGGFCVHVLTANGVLYLDILVPAWSPFQLLIPTDASSRISWLKTQYVVGSFLLCFKNSNRSYYKKRSTYYVFICILKCGVKV